MCVVGALSFDCEESEAMDLVNPSHGMRDLVVDRRVACEIRYVGGICACAVPFVVAAFLFRACVCVCS
jgi:hypothetical protein